MMRMRRLLVAATVLGASALATAGSGAGVTAVVSGSYVGTVRGTNAFVAVVVGKQKAGSAQQAVLAYVCDGKQIAEWFKGTAGAARFSLASKDGARLVVTVGAGDATGTFTAGGASHAFAAASAKRPAGLYRGKKTAHDTDYLGGWIVLPDRRQRGAVKTGTSILASPTVTGFINPIGGLAVSVASAGTLTVGFVNPISGL